eukprot:scaffold28030_cov72-Phaeocystis_antarctica.AAC.4
MPSEVSTSVQVATEAAAAVIARRSHARPCYSSRRRRPRSSARARAAVARARFARARVRATVNAGKPPRTPSPCPLRRCRAAGRRDSVRRLGRPLPVVAVRVVEQGARAQARRPPLCFAQIVHVVGRLARRIKGHRPTARQLLRRLPARDQMEADAAGRGQAGDGEDLGDRLGCAVIGYARPLRGLVPAGRAGRGDQRALAHGDELGQHRKKAHGDAVKIEWHQHGAGVVLVDGPC